MAIAASDVWITGKQFGDERRRLLMEGKRDDSPEMQSLLARIYDRDDYIWERFAPSLMHERAGDWAAIALGGESVIHRTSSEALTEATQRFGESNFAFGRLSEFPGHDTSRC